MSWTEQRSLDEIFAFQGTGILTARDKLNVAFERDELISRLRRFASADQEVARRDFDLGPDKRDWSIENAQEDVKQTKLSQKFLRKVSYRPFDERTVYYTGQSKGLIGQPARPLADAIDVSGIALGTVRRVEEGDFRHAYVVSSLPDGHSVSSKETTHVFPLYLRGKSAGSLDSRIENLSSEFRTFIDTRYEHQYTPEEVLGYVYAVLYAPAYRVRNAEFLRTEFPRIPFPEQTDHFEAVSSLGWQLVQAHLLRALPRRKLAEYHGKGDHTVESVRYTPQELAIHINKTQYFKSVPQAVWDFRIGGYQVLDKYLKSRKGRALSLDEINHIGAVADCLAFTIDQMVEIDKVYCAAFPDQM